MKMIFKVFAKKLFGAKYERLARALSACLIVFLGLYTAGIRIRIEPAILYLTVSVFTAGAMWQALSSREDTVNIQNLFMLPFHDRTLIFSYTAALGIYTICTKTAMLLAVLSAVSGRARAAFAGGVLCAVNAALMTAAVYVLKKCRYAGGYAFYSEEKAAGRTVEGRRRHCVLRYFLRYLKYHKNYLTNTAAIWCAACALPLLFKQTQDAFALPICFAILSLNTPLCILLSCDPDLEQAIRCLPGQAKAFCVPYSLFLFLCNIAADTVCLISWQIINGGVRTLTAVIACLFALSGAVLSVLLEWHCPIRNWKIESDLWHHPRKYAVPALMLLLAGIFSTFLL